MTLKRGDIRKAVSASKDVVISCYDHLRAWCASRVILQVRRCHGDPGRVHVCDML